MNLGAVIKRIRKRKGLTQKDIADQIGFSVMSLSKIENNQTQPHKETLEKIAKSLQVPVTYLVFLSLDDSEIKDEKKPLYNALMKNFEDLVFND